MNSFSLITVTLVIQSNLFQILLKLKLILTVENFYGKLLKVVKCNIYKVIIR